MNRLLFLAALLGLAGTARGADYCARYNGFPQQCQYDAGCFWNFQAGLCQDRYPSGGIAFCRSLDGDPAHCDAEPDCYFDTFGQICAQRPNGPWTPIPCRNLDSDPARCNAQPGCYFDTFGDICAQRF